MQIKLNVRGIMKKDLQKKYAHIVDYQKNKNEAILFCEYSEFDIPIGHATIWTKI